MTTDGKRIEYSSKNGYTGVIYGKSTLVVYDGTAKEVFRTGNRAIETIGELKTFVDSFPAFVEMLKATTDPEPMIPQIRDFRGRFQELHEETPRYVICNRRTFRELETEAGIGYISGNPCTTVYGMKVVVPEDGEIIIGNGYVEKYRFKGGTE